MAHAVVPRIRRFEDSTVPVGGRIMTSAGIPAVQADVSTVTYKVFDSADAETGSGTLTVASVISNTLNTVAWEEDAEGTNFRYNFPAASFPGGNVVYTIEVKVTLTDGFVDWIIVEVETVSVKTS